MGSITVIIQSYILNGPSSTKNAVKLVQNQNDEVIDGCPAMWECDTVRDKCNSV